MKTAFLKTMKCPYCSGDFSISRTIKEANGEINSGIITCECNEYPVLEGILILLLNRTKEHVLESLKKNRGDIAPPFINFMEDMYRIQDSIRSGGIAGRAIAFFIDTVIDRQNRRLHSKYSKSTSVFSNLMSKDSISYFVHRFSSQSFWPLYSLIPLLKRKKQRILDLCCGVGHSSFVISEYVHPDELICCDRSFRSLYFAKNYFVKNAEFIVLDANYSLPFKDEHISSVLTMDSLHALQARALCVSELERILTSDGLLLALHLPNSLVYKPMASTTLSSSGWANLFKNIPVKTIPEERLIEDFILQNKLDLLRIYSDKEINAASAICVAGCHEQEIFKDYQLVNGDFLMNKDNLVINPIYKIHPGADEIILKRNPPSEAYRMVYPLTDKFLPEEVVIGKHLLQLPATYQLNINAGVSSEDIKYIEGLMKQFVILNVPERYIQK